MVTDPSAYDLIDKKKRGGEHDAREIEFLVRGLVEDAIPDYQLAAWLMAVWHRGMSVEETFLLTENMRDSGRTLDVRHLPGPTADKHSTGGVGDKISLLLAPVAACIGLYVPMLSGRGLGHTGGTIDKLESIPGYRANLLPEEMLRVVEEVGCSINGQTTDIAPADKRLYALRDVTATVDCVPLIVSSILSKKLAAGPHHLVIDLKCGSGAFMRELEDARALGQALLSTGRRAGLVMSVLVTDMGQVIGSAVGHALEVQEALDGLRGKGPADQRELTIELVAEMGRLAGLGEADAVRPRIERALDDGSAMERFLRMARAHGARLNSNDPGGGLAIAPEAEALVAQRSGYVASVDAAGIGLAVVELGGGRVHHEDDIDSSVGLRVQFRIGDEIKAGDELVRIYGRDRARLARCRQRLVRSIQIVDHPVAPAALILERLR